MPLSQDFSPRGSSYGGVSSSCLEDRFELLKDIGDGSFGSVALARVRTAGAQIARRGTLVAIKTMKKTFESFSPCLELREVIFLRSVPTHAHLVPALDMFLDPISKKLHICMENMDGNLYQLMKSREHKCLDGSSVKSILFQILSGLGHIHQHQFFHRDIKPENILVSTSAPQDVSTSFRRYSAMITPPSTPPSYSIKIADFGLARETNSPHPYTTYVSTRWYRAPEVLLRAGEYSAPVDIWALGAMAVEIANLKPLFPGANEVDQVWRVCEIMGSPGNWYDKAGNRVGGGDWREGTRLAHKLGFSFPKMAPHSMETILRPPQWPPAFASFVTWCLMWDPRNRPTSLEAMRHEFFTDASDPLRPRSSTSRILGKKHASIDGKSYRDSTDGTAAASKPSWFRKSLIRDHTPVVPSQTLEQPCAPAEVQHSTATRPPVVQNKTDPVQESSHTNRFRPFAGKRSTWTNGTAPPNAAPMPILPSIRPISPFSAAVNAEAQNNPPLQATQSNIPAAGAKTGKKIGRQLSIQSQSNHYADLHCRDSERALSGSNNPQSPSEQRGFFSHLRKKARRFSGKPSVSSSSAIEDVPSKTGSPRQSQRNTMIVDSNMDSILENNFGDVDKALHSAAYGTTPLSPSPEPVPSHQYLPSASTTDLTPQRHPSLSKSISTPAFESSTTPISTRTRRALQKSTHPSHIYDTPNEEDELLHEALTSAQNARKNMERRSQIEAQHDQGLLKTKHDVHAVQPSFKPAPYLNPYPTPSPPSKRNGMLFEQNIMTEPVTKLRLHEAQRKENIKPRWPTPPSEENEWAASAAASIFAAGSIYQ
ncbi:uncharacterized protein KY384_004472 [Bacidia gigantensis]|uniref:uncharacterized protein n=1 Tax=Bacidia gigantensis TaxID=2732470 RepID=UPI001D058587|nr:uncharacterized protein KY384_004472 [Bacidia gigantensis]KAG8531115.1 hypothetical protein KY384_004472 [Bacidia gigantensis]